MPEENQQEAGKSGASGGSGSRFSSDALIGGAVWVFILAAVGFGYFRVGRADVLLNVSGLDPIVASGAVTSDGAPVSGGRIQILIEDPRGGRLLASAVSEVTNVGGFSLDFKKAQLNGSRTNGLRITGNYVGIKPGEGGATLRGTSSAYLNMTPPWTMGMGFLLVPLTIGLLVVLFTGPCHRGKHDCCSASPTSSPF